MGTKYFPTGTTTIFRQTVAPIGWTKVTTYNNYALRIVGSGSFSPTGGGSLNFTSVMTNQSITGTVSLSTSPGGYPVAINSSAVNAPLPVHAHPGVARFFNTIAPMGPAVPIVPQGGFAFTDSPQLTGTSGNVGGTDGHSHTLTCSASYTGDTKNFSVNYVDVIIASIN